MTNSMQPHGLQHARLLCSSLSPRVCSNSCPLRWWCYVTSSCSATLFSFGFQSLSIRVYSSALALHIMWPKHWIFSICPSNEYSELISFRIDWFDLLAVQWDTQESFPRPQFKSINSLVQLSHPYMTTGKTIDGLYRLLSAIIIP